ncbi:MAG: cell envelope integrity protein CreD [Maricaulaceae bacterium]
MKLLNSKSYSLKLIILAGLVILMAIPAMIISDIVYERSDRADQAVVDVSKRYGGAQRVVGPVLVVPSWTERSLKNAALDPLDYKPNASQYVIYPETGMASFEDMKLISRKRALFKVPTYQGQADLTARFPALSELDGLEGRIFNMDEAAIFIAISDPRGLLSDPVLELSNGQYFTFRPTRLKTATACCDIEVIDDKIVEKSAPRGLQFNSHLTFLYVPVGDILPQILSGDISVSFRLSGAQSLSVPPFAQSTQAQIKSDWPHPGFSGHFPPTDFTTNDEGFSAHWSIPFLARGIAAHGPADNMLALTSADRTLQVNFVTPLNSYRILNRALKYSIFFIGMVFLTFFLSELVLSVQIHPAQYGLVGLAQTVFYLLLLAFSEHIGFNLGFVISAAATVSLTALYAATSFGKFGYAVRYGVIFTSVYGFMFLLLRVQGVSLLTSAIVCFLLIALTMYLTRDLDWYAKTEAVTLTPTDASPRNDED